jgi:hypothetical protein
MTKIKTAITTPFNILENEYEQSIVIFFAKLYQLLYMVDEVSITENRITKALIIRIKDCNEEVYYHWYEFFYEEVPRMHDKLWMLC